MSVFYPFIDLALRVGKFFSSRLAHRPITYPTGERAGQATAAGFDSLARRGGRFYYDAEVDDYFPLPDDVA